MTLIKEFLLSIFDRISLKLDPLISFFDNMDENIFVMIFGIVSVVVAVFTLHIGVKKIQLDLHDKMGMIAVLFSLIYIVTIGMVVILNAFEMVFNFVMKFF